MIWPSFIMVGLYFKSFIKINNLKIQNQSSNQNIQSPLQSTTRQSYTPQMFQQSLTYLQQPPQQFNLSQILLSLCKKSSLQCPQIDFLDFQHKLQLINSFHQRTCQQIVQFVDTHCGQYIEINSKFSTLQQKISQVQSIIKQLSTKLRDYAKVYYQDEGKVQRMITGYEEKVVEKVLLNKCKEETQFLGKFVIAFEGIICKSMDTLVFSQRSLLLRFCKKYISLETLFSHHLLHQTLPEYIKISQLLTNLVDEVEFYISEQLSKLIKYKPSQRNNMTNTTTSNDPKAIALHQIKLCYTYLEKLSQYYKNMEQNLIGRQLQVAQKNLISSKLNIIGGKNLQVVEQFFKSIFHSITQFPSTYPRNRLLQLIYNQLRKPQVKFLYTYTLPIFPISYNYYTKYINALDQSQVELISGLSQNHNWDLKRWIDVRQKNVIDRCTKDWQKDKDSQDKSKCPDLGKWIEIIFKDNCKIDGIKNHVVALAIKVVTKFAHHIQTCDRLDPEHMNQVIDIYHSIEKLLMEKLVFFYDAQQAAPLMQLIHKITKSCKQTLQTAISRLIQNNTKLLSKSCIGSLQPIKPFIMKIIKSSKQLTQHGHINTYSSTFKPLTSYLQNNQSLSEYSQKWMTQTVLKEVIKHYDETYVPEVYQYARTNLSAEQVTQVMDVVAKERVMVFGEVGSQQ